MLEMLHLQVDELQVARQEYHMRRSTDCPSQITVGVGHAQVGGGTLPRSVLDSVTLDMIHGKLKPQEMAARLREHSVPIIGYIGRGKFKLDLRTIFPRQDAELIKAIHDLCV